MYKLEHLTSKTACYEAVWSAHHDSSVETVLFCANMRFVSQRQISMLRQLIDDMIDGASSSNVQTKKWVLLLHFMPGAALSDCYPSLFLYGWSFWYLDSCTGGAAQNEMLQMSSWTASAVALLNGQAVTPEDLLGGLCSKQTLLPYQTLHSCSPLRCPNWNRLGKCSNI